MSNFITSSKSNPRGLAYVAYGDPERYAQIKNQIKGNSSLPSSKLDSFSPELIKDCIYLSLKEIFSSYKNSKYSFITSKDILDISEKIYQKMYFELNSISSYLDSVLTELLDFMHIKFSFISLEESEEIMRELFLYLRG